MKKMMERLACAAIVAFAASAVFAKVEIQQGFESTFAESGFVKSDAVEDAIRKAVLQNRQARAVPLRRGREKGACFLARSFAVKEGKDRDRQIFPPVPV